MRSDHRVVGHPAFSPIGTSKVTGAGRYPPDYAYPDVLHAGLLGSDVPHAVISHFDARGASAIPGVEAVLSRADLGLDDTVRHVGDVVAAVAAETPELVSAALAAIEVSYDRLAVVADPRAALESGAPLLEPGKDSNLALLVDFHSGDIESALAAADVVYEAEYTTGRPTHCNLSPRLCFARAGDTLEIMSSVDAPHFARRELAHELGIPVEQVSLSLPELMTSSFGGRSSINRHCEPIAARLAMAVPGRQVRLSYDPVQEFVAGTTRHAITAKLVAGATATGRLTALDIDLVADHGPYDSFVNRIVLSAGRDRPLDLWSIDHYRYRGRAVLTNNLMGGEMRGIGATQINYLLGAHMDELARKIGVDPLEFTLRNMADSARGRPSGGLEECLRQGAAAFGWGDPGAGPSRPGSGVGLGIGTHTTGLGTFHGPDSASAVVVLEGDRVVVSTAAPDSGQGMSTVVAQIVAEELGVEVRSVEMLPIDTASAPADAGGSVASRGTYVVGSAVRHAALDLREKALQAAAGYLGSEPGDLVMDGAVIRRLDGSGSVPVSQLDVRLEGRAEAVMDKTPPTYGAYFAEVTVDQDSGAVSVLRLVAAIDVGFAVNPSQCRGQVEGAIAHGLEFALGAEVVVRGGFPENTSLVDYRVARASDMPEIEVILVEGADADGPYGARGIGTPAITPVLPAVANAVRDAIGRHMRKVPMWPEEVAETLKQGVG